MAAANRVKLAKRRGERSITVGKHGCDYKTISAALTAAAALVPAPSDTDRVEILAEPGTFTEDLTMTSYTRVIGSPEWITRIVGQVTFPAACTEAGVDTVSIVSTNKPAVVVSCPGYTADVRYAYVKANWSVATGVVRSAVQITGGRLHLYSNCKIDMIDTDTTNNGATAYRTMFYSSGADAALLETSNCRFFVQTPNLQADLSIILHTNTSASSDLRMKTSEGTIYPTGALNAHVNAVRFADINTGRGLVTCSANEFNIYPTNGQNQILKIGASSRAATTAGTVTMERNRFHHTGLLDTNVFTGEATTATDTYRGLLNTYEVTADVTPLRRTTGGSLGAFRGSHFNSFGVLGVVDANAPRIYLNGVNIRGAYVSMDDDTTYDLPASVVGHGEIDVGDDEGYCVFSYKLGATVTIRIDLPANKFVNTDTDNRFCVIDNGTNVRFKNRLGGTRTVRFVTYYT